MSTDPKCVAAMEPADRSHRVEPADDPVKNGHGAVTLRAGHERAPRDDDVLDVSAASRLLRVGRNTVYELVGRNQIPHRRLGKQIRFSRAAIRRWFDSWSSQGAKERQ
jgi:excisionase family DNA binding protein